MTKALSINLDDKGQNQTPLRLFVWEGFAPDYTEGLAFAIAQDEVEARKLVVKAYLDGCEPSCWGTLTVRALEPIAFAVGGGG